MNSSNRSHLILGPNERRNLDSGGAFVNASGIGWAFGGTVNGAGGHAGTPLVADGMDFGFASGL